jgi:hypothetical protein
MAELWEPVERKFNYRSSAGQLVRVDPPLQIVHEHFRVELVVIHLTARPSHSPLSKTKDDLLKLFAGSSGMIFDPPLIGHRFPDDEAGLFKLVEGLVSKVGEICDNARWKSLKRVVPSTSSRIIRRVQRSPSSSAALDTRQIRP